MSTRNERRAGRIPPALSAHAQAVGDGGGNPCDDDVRDLLTDLMHFCRLELIDFAYELDQARINFNEEAADDEDNAESEE